MIFARLALFGSLALFYPPLPSRLTIDQVDHGKLCVLSVGSSTCCYSALIAGSNHSEGELKGVRAGSRKIGR